MAIDFTDEDDQAAPMGVRVLINEMCYNGYGLVVFSKKRDRLSAAHRPQQENRSQSLTREGRFVPPEPLEDRAVQVGEPLETQGQLALGAGRGVAAGIPVGWPGGVAAVSVAGPSQNRVGLASKTSG